MFHVLTYDSMCQSADAVTDLNFDDAFLCCNGVLDGLDYRLLCKYTASDNTQRRWWLGYSESLSVGSEHLACHVISVGAVAQVVERSLSM